VARGRRFAIVASRFHEEITTRLVDGARETLRRHAAAERDVVVVWVPGAFEIPQVARRLAEGGAFDALVCVGCVVRGETPHFEYVAGEAARGIAEVGRETGVPVTFGVITAETMAQARARAGGEAGNRGEEAALAALELVELFAMLDPRPKGRGGQAKRRALPGGPSPEAAAASGERRPGGRRPAGDGREGSRGLPGPRPRDPIDDPPRPDGQSPQARDAAAGTEGGAAPLR
jgi:6,7-dimethyl-8-ribityllumazine synthase